VTFTWTLDRDLPVAVVRLAGTLDPDAVPEARLALHQGLAVQPAAMVIDVSDLRGAEGAGADLLRAVARSAAAWPGCRVVVCGASNGLAAALERCGGTRLMDIHPDRAQALSAVAAPAPRRYWRLLSPSPAAAALARSTVVAACAAWRLGDVVDRAELIVTELVGNAVVHAGTEMELVVSRRDGLLSVSLGDACADPPRRRSHDRVDATGGRGLVLIEALATSWGYLPTRAGKVVWALLRCEPPGYGDPVDGAPA
jgi:anti-anti-sigma regulatory factor/anti-sigma regulatory factor (Ser/Thr protein kinase)